MKKKKVLAWILNALIRAVRTMAQTAMANIGVMAVMSQIDWMMVLISSGVAGLISVLMSVSRLPEIKLKQKNKPVGDSKCADGLK